MEAFFVNNIQYLQHVFVLLSLGKAIHIFSPRVYGPRNRFWHGLTARFGEFDQKGQIGAVEHPAIGTVTGGK